MAVEAKRGCGYRKVGGLYLVAGGLGRPCCKMPLELSVCPCCNAGVKQTRGWTWIDAGKMFAAGGCRAPALERSTCPVVNPAGMGKVGLLWIGEKFYKRPSDFEQEAASMGISRRLTAVPRDFKAGDTWVMFAHPKAIQKARRVVNEGDGWTILRPDEEREGDYCWHDSDPEALRLAEEKAAALDLEDPCYVAGIIRVARPQGFERIVKQSEFDRAMDYDKERLELERDAKRGVRWVPVPDDDKDHAGTVYDKAELEQ